MLGLYVVLQYVVVTVCIKAGLETSAWTYVSGNPSRDYSGFFGLRRCKL